MYAYNNARRIPYGSDDGAKMYGELGTVLRANPDGEQGHGDQVVGAHPGMESNDTAIFNQF